MFAKHPWMKWVVAVAALLQLARCAMAAPAPDPESVRDLLNAIRQVETGGEKDPAKATGDGGLAIGPYQIHEPYWRDSKMAGEYRQCRDQAYAEQVMLRYWQRYCPRALESRNYEVMARTHTGGPRGSKAKATQAYWAKVQKALKAAEKE